MRSRRRQPAKNPGQIAEENLKRIIAHHEARTAKGLPDEIPGQEGIDAKRLNDVVEQMNGFVENGSDPHILGASLALVVELSSHYIKTYLDPTSETS